MIVTDLWKYLDVGGSMYTTTVIMQRNNCIGVHNTKFKKLHILVLFHYIHQFPHKTYNIATHYLSTQPHTYNQNWVWMFKWCVMHENSRLIILLEKFLPHCCPITFEEDGSRKVRTYYTPTFNILFVRRHVCMQRQYIHGGHWQKSSQAQQP